MRVKLSIRDFYSSNEEYLRLVYPERDALEGEISSASLQRPGLVLAGVKELFIKGAVQFLGRDELLYISTLSDEKAGKKLTDYLSLHPPALIIGEEADEEQVKFIVSIARERSIPVFVCLKCNCYERINNFLHWELSERIVIHGELLGVYGVGILIIGESGIGKSEIALELISRGHMFVADDIVEVLRLPEGKIVGISPEKIRGFMEIRGLGAINVNEIFGGAVLPFSPIDLILELREFNKNEERLFLEEEKMEILGVEIPARKIPVAAGRNIANLIEVAARLYLLARSGIYPLKELMERIGEV